MGAMFSLVSVTLFEQSFGPNVVGIGHLGRGEASRTPEELSIPWHDLLPDSGVFPLLSWHTETSRFVGRESEIGTLDEWAESSHTIRVKFLVGEGGVGKSRLGAEFAKHLQNKGWAAGFVNLRKPQTFRMNKLGTLLIVDYPEEHTKNVTELLKDLTDSGQKNKIRVLFLTRQEPERWESEVALANARNIMSGAPLRLRDVDVESAVTIFNTTLDRAAQDSDRPNLGESQITDVEMAAWQKLAPENRRTLFIVAAAVHSLDNPNTELVDYKGREVIDSLAQREIGRLQRIASSRGYTDQFALARLLALAAIADRVDETLLQSLQANEKTPLGFPSDKDPLTELDTAGFVFDGAVPSPRPDIVAAVFLLKILGKTPKVAPEYLWTALDYEMEYGLERLGRLSHDTEIVLAIDEPRLSSWLNTALAGSPERCLHSAEFFGQSYLPIALSNCAVVLWQTLLTIKADDEARASALNNLSTQQFSMGDSQRALKSIRESVAIWRRLVYSSPGSFENDLASSLNNESNYLAYLGDESGALNAIGETVQIRRRLVASDPSRFNPALASSLMNMSGCQLVLGDPQGGLVSARESIGISRALDEITPTRFAPDLAKCLLVEAICLFSQGDTQLSQISSCEAVEINRQLAASNPARFEPDLARSLGFQGRILKENDPQLAVSLLVEASKLIEPYVAALPSSPDAEIQEEILADLAIAKAFLKQK